MEYDLSLIPVQTSHFILEFGLIFIIIMLTIPIQFLMLGRVKELGHDEGLHKLSEFWISKASAKQRAGMVAHNCLVSDAILVNMYTTLI